MTLISILNLTYYRNIYYKDIYFKCNRLNLTHKINKYVLKCKNKD